VKQVPSSGPVSRARERALTPLRAIHPVWRLNVAISTAAVLLWLGPVNQYAPIAEPVLPWWLLALAIAVAETWPVNLEFRRSAHSFSLTDIPLTLGLLFSSGGDAVLGIVAGGALALAVCRLPPVKFVFNLAQFALVASAGVLIVRGIGGADATMGPETWLAIYGATQVGGLLTIALLASVIWLAERSLTPQQVRQMFGMDAVVTLTNTSLALVLAVVVVERPIAVPILMVPVVVVFLIYRAYVAERQRHEKIQFLYEANRTLSGSPEMAEALEGLLRRAREAFRAEQAEVLLLPEDGPALRTSLGAGGEICRMEPVDPELAASMRDFAAAHGEPVTLVPPFPATIRDALEEQGVRNAMLAVLHGESRVIGTIMLANRFGLGGTFTAEDLKLFETLAANASNALQYDRLEQAVGDLQRLQAQLRHQATHDPLTGLANRTLFGHRVRAALAGHEQPPAAVMFIDLDDFKAVNDTLGHAAGDELLVAVGGRLRLAVREDDVVARLGGDEFALLLCHEDVESGAADVAERIMRAFGEPVHVAGRRLSVQLSIGIATTRHSGARAEDLLRDADVAMYQAKEAGKGRYAMFSPEMRETILRRHGLKEELAAAIEDHQLVVEYQPIVDLASGRTRAMEALVRWNHPSRGRIPPLEFIPLAEETGLIVGLGRKVLAAACRQASQWTAEHPAEPPVEVHVNLSTVELEQPDLVAHVRRAIAEAGILPRQLVVEVTETSVLRDAHRGPATLHALRELGVQVGLDDFGTGYSSLSYLRSLPLDCLKIAREFVDDMTESEEEAAFVRLIVGLASTIGLRVVAEGIETPEQLARLRELGCELGQGYYFSPPLAAFEPRLPGVEQLAST